MLLKSDTTLYFNPQLLVTHTRMGHVEFSWQKTGRAGVEYMTMFSSHNNSQRFH